MRLGLPDRRYLRSGLTHGANDSIRLGDLKRRASLIVAQICVNQTRSGLFAVLGADFYEKPDP
jgi:hypothetical protein